MSSTRSSIGTMSSGTEDGDPESMIAYQGRSLDYLGVDILLLIFDEVSIGWNCLIWHSLYAGVLLTILLTSLTHESCSLKGFFLFFFFFFLDLQDIS